MAIRTVLGSKIFSLLRVQQHSRIYFLTPPFNRGDFSQLIESENITWLDITSPVGAGYKQRFLSRICRGIWWRVFKLLRAGFGNLVFRFNQLHNFQGHRQKVKMPPERRQREALAGNFVDSKLGIPFPDSKRVYNFIYHLHHCLWQCNDPQIEYFVDKINPERMIFWHVQVPSIKPYSLAARRRKIPCIAVPGSWDRPTTKGPMYPEIARYIVNNIVMKKELEEFHDVPSSDIDVVGWPQMDVYHDKQHCSSKKEFLSELNLPSNHQIIVYTANCERLGPHEPGLVEHIAQNIKKEFYPGTVTLLIRPHPQDVVWQQRFSNVKDMDQVKILPSEMGKLDFLADLLRHADVVIATQGSVSLDAVALDACTINIAFDGYLDQPEHQSVKLWYAMDHYLPVVQSGGVKVVTNFEEMNSAISGYLQNPDLDKHGRQRLRELELAPLDGSSSMRIVDALFQPLKDSTC